jgi:hypothetical protein
MKIRAKPVRALLQPAIVSLAVAFLAGTGHGGGTPIDITAERAFLRTGPGFGEEVALPVEGQPLYFHVEYRLTGSDIPVEAGVRALIDGVSHCEGSVNLQPGGVFVIWCQNEWVATPGLHTLRWELDWEDIVAEADESDNVADLDFTVPGPGVDLVAERAFLGAAPGSSVAVPMPAVGQQLFFHLDYRVTGATLPIRTAVRAVIDGNEHCGGPVDLLPGGVFQVWCANAWDATGGMHTLLWQLDEDDAVDEANEQNNDATLLFYAGAGEGDANCDGIVSAPDLTRLATLFAAGERSACGFEDADGNGTFDARDLDATIAAVFL